MVTRHEFESRTVGLHAAKRMRRTGTLYYRMLHNLAAASKNEWLTEAVVTDAERAIL